ncbi:hypothetical protein QLX08_009127 [Tetragonisca angustula]|uniref:Uncharacterized protein n=1 Tax=Tetragonisca angustula TaxID=166442 RepID=A0AAW0ZK02_9HYME
MSQSEDAYAPEEPTPDIPISLLDIQMPETPDSTKGQTSDGDTSRLESPKILKPVLGKLKAKKRLLAFANKFNVPSKIQNKSNLLQAHSTKISKSKSMSSDNGKSSKNDSVVNVNPDNSVQYHNRHSSGGKSKKKTEEKILAIEEIRREESKSKMLLAEAMAAASLEEETYANRNGQNLLENEKIMRERNRQDDVNVSYKSTSKSTIENKYSGRRRYGREERRDNTNRESKDYNSSKERYYKVSRNKEQRRKDKGRKVDKDKREDGNRYEENRDRRDEERDKKNSDKWEDVREKKGIKEKRESFKEKRNDSQEKLSEIKERKEKEKDKGKERDIMNSSSWAELKKCGITIDDIIETRRYDHSERTTKNRTAEDYLRHLEQMLMMNDCRLKRYAFIAEGLEGPKEYPPESIRVTKRGRPQLFYSENPRMSLFMDHQQILQTVTTDHREKMRNIYEGDYIRNDMEETEKSQHVRNWYPKKGICKSGENTKWHVPINVQLPRSKWDSEDEDKLSDTEKQENEVISSNIALEQEPEEFSPRLNTMEEDINKDKEIINEDEASTVKKIDDNRQPSPLLQSAGNEKLASEYEQFMKMVCNDIPISKEFSPKLNKPPASTLSYHEFNIETNSPNDNNFSFVEHNISGKLDESDSNKIEEKFKANENRQNLEKVSKIEDDQVSSSSSHIQAQKSATADSKNIRDKNESEDSKSIPSDWENVRIKVERMSDENSDSKETRKKKRRKKTTSSSSESSSSSSSSDSEEEIKRKKRKRKISNDSDSLSDSDSSDSSTSSSDSSSSDDKRKKKKKKKRKAEKRKKKAKRIAKTKKKRRRKISSDSSSSDSSQDRKKKRVVTKKSKQKKESSNKQDNREDIVKTIQKSPLESSSLENAKLIRSQVPLKKIKEEVKIENRKRSTDKHDVWNKEQDMVRKVISDNDIRNKTRKDEEKRNKVEERYLEEWEMDSVIIPQKGEKLSKSNVEKVENTNVENIRKIEGKDERTKKDDKSKSDEHFKEKCSNINKEIIPGSLKIEEDIDGKKKRKRDKEKKSSEFLTEWEKESERISQQIMQDEMKLSKKLDKQKKEKWGETEFDTLNVPSLTQLEREVSSRQLLADEWEVDSLEAVPDLMINKKRTSRTSKKLEKEVRYDKKTDMYITIEKETLKECKKRQDRLSAMRIWEEEQEEGEKEAMMLLEQKNKRKRDDWDIEEESYLREKSDRKESIEDNIAIIDNIHKEVNIVSKAADTSMKHDVITRKKGKKSRWDMASQSEEKIELKAPVMWEEECTEWTKGNKFDHNIERVSLEHCDSILPNTKIRDEDVCMIEQQLRKSTAKNSTGSDIIDLFPRKSQDIDLLESSWTSEEHTRSKSRIKSLNSSQEDVFFDKTKELTPSKEQLKDIFEMDMKLTKKNTELYSPSSPAGSQKSEDMEIFKNNHTNSLSLEENFLHDKPKNENVVKSDDESVPNIPLQIKYCDGKYAKSAIKEEFEEILGVKKTEDQILRAKFDMKASENSPELQIKQPYSDMSYKSLRMDIFTGYESDELRGKLINKSSETASSSASTKGTEETNEGKAALKLIPKQLLVRRNNERVKTKLISDDPMQHAAALLTIQKKLRESHAAKNDIKDISCEEPSAEFKIECEKTTNIHAPTSAEVIPTEQTTITDVKVDSKDLSITVKTSITTKSESPGAVKLDFNEYKSGNKGIKLEELKKSRPRNSKDVSDIECRIRSPGGEQKKKSPSRKENREDKRISDRNKEKRDKKFDDRERGDRRDNRGLKQEYNESRRRSSPSGSSRNKKSISWEREGSRSESHSRSWSRSRSKSPKRKEELFAGCSKEKRLSRIDEDRCSRSRIDDRRERPVRSPHRSNTVPYSKEHFKKHGTTKGDRDEWNRRKYDFMEREKESRSYEPIEVLRERNVDFDKHRESRFREDEGDRSLWPYEAENMLRDGNESLDSYPNSQDLDLDFEEKSYYRDDNIERDIMEGPFRPSSKFKHRKSRPAAKRNRQWEKEREPLDLDRHGHVRRTEKLVPSRGRSPPRSRRSPRRSSHEHFRHESRSRSKSWSRSRSRSRSRSTSRSRSIMRSRSRSRSGSRSRTRSTSGSRMRTPDHFRMTERLRSSRSPSMGRGRISESSRERKDEHDNMKLDSYIERGRRIETIVQSVSGLPRDSTVLDSEMHIGDNMETIAAGFQYSAENEVGNEYYYTENNLTYPPCIDDSTASSPKRLSLDDRLELELGIKKQQDGTAVSNDYGESFNSNVCYPSSPQQQQQMLYRQQPTVLQVGNVLQVVPADFNGVPATHREPTNSSSTSVVRGSSQVVRVGNVLQVVPTSLDWSGGGQPSSVDQSGGMIYSTTVPQSSPVSSVPMSVPVPVPVPMPVPAVPSAVNSSTPVSTLSPLPLSVPVPVPGPVPLPVTQTTFSRTEVTPQRVPVLPVYNYEVILETRKKEREERKRLREIKRKEKERRRIERINRRALQLLEKNNMRQSESTNQQKSSALDPSVLKALRESEEQCDTEEQQTSATVFEKEEEITPVIASSAPTEEEEVPVEEDEEEEEEEEAEVEDDEEEEEEAEDDEEEEEEDDEKSRLNKSKNEVDEAAATTPMDETNKIETESKGWPELLPPPLKGILVASGFRRTSVPNGNLDDLSTPENDSGDNTDKEGTEIEKNESNKDETGDNKPSKLKIQTKKTKLTKQSKRKQRSKKSVQFADGIKPGEGTSPSGGEGDMPSPPPPISVARSGARDVRRSSSRKSRKQEKRTRPPKAKKKVKVKIIKLKKPRVTPLTAMMMDDSDELDDRSPPPPPPGSPPPPHLWPSYLSAYNATSRTNEAQSTATVSSTVQTPPPPTPLPLLVPPPPLNYTIQPCSKA